MRSALRYALAYALLSLPTFGILAYYSAPAPTFDPETLLHTCVRVHTPAGDGTGILIAPEYVLTAKHVAPTFAEITVDVFHWTAGDIAGFDTLTADSVTTSSDYDLALLHIPGLLGPVADILPAALDSRLHRFLPVIRIGCPLGREPLHTRGEITDLNDEDRLLSDAPVIFGDSGGGLFVLLDGHPYLIAIASQMAAIGPFGTPVPHLSAAVPTPHLREALEIAHDPAFGK